MSISLPITSGTIGNLTQLTVDARALHEVLEVKRDFSNWIKARIAKYDFVEGEDYEKSSMIPSSPKMANGIKTAIEYRLSVNMGKELAMVENNERGKLVRRYFIECERRLMETPAPALPPLSTVESRRTLNTLVRQWANLSGLSYPDCWAEVHIAFDIDAVADLPAALVKEAEVWVQARIRECSAPAAIEPDFPLELANCGRKGKEIVNLWAELEDLKKKLAWCNNMVFLACSEGRLMCLTAEKNLLHTILKESVKAAQDSLSMAQSSVQAALRIKSQVDFHSI